MVRRHDHVLVVLDDDDRVAEVTQMHERLDQPVVVALVRTDRRLAEHLHDAREARAELRGEPLRDYETVVRLIAATTTAKGLKVTCRLDHRKYPVGRRITDEEFAHVNLKTNKFHGEWNYTIHPRN